MMIRLQPFSDFRFAGKTGEPIFKTPKLDVYRSDVEPEQTDTVSWKQLQDMMGTVLSLNSNEALNEADVAGLALVKSAQTAPAAEEPAEAPVAKKGISAWIKSKIGTLFEAAGIFARKVFWLMTRKDEPTVPLSEIRKGLNI